MDLDLDFEVSSLFAEHWTIESDLHFLALSPLLPFIPLPLEDYYLEFPSESDDWVTLGQLPEDPKFPPLELPTLVEQFSPLPPLEMEAIESRPQTPGTVEEEL
jgi:hypothetical protein